MPSSFNTLQSQNCREEKKTKQLTQVETSARIVKESQISAYAIFIADSRSEYPHHSRHRTCTEGVSTLTKATSDDAHGNFITIY